MPKEGDLPVFVSPAAFALIQQLAYELKLDPGAVVEVAIANARLFMAAVGATRGVRG